MDKNFWNKRYIDQDTPWDAGNVTTPISDYIDKLTDQSLHILIPGAGLCHEAKYLLEKGFENITICDWAAAPLQQFGKSNPSFPKSRLVCEDFFILDIEVDLIIEQTFFCALPPQLRPAYAEKVHSLLKPKGRLVGLLFAEMFDKKGPPFGGTKEEYLDYFNPYFDIHKMELANNSIKPRAGRELFIDLERKNEE